MAVKAVSGYREGWEARSWKQNHSQQGSILPAKPAAPAKEKGRPEVVFRFSTVQVIGKACGGRQVKLESLQVGIRSHEGSMGQAQLSRWGFHDESSLKSSWGVQLSRSVDPWPSTGMTFEYARDWDFNSVAQAGNVLSGLSWKEVPRPMGRGLWERIVCNLRAVHSMSQYWKYGFVALGNVILLYLNHFCGITTKEAITVKYLYAHLQT